MQSAVTPHSGRLYRIMRFERVVQMFERNELTFLKPLLWEDPYETHFKHADLDSVFAQCWCAKGVSDAMWRIYSPDRTGIRISTSTKLLRSAVAAEAALAGFDYIERGVEYLPPVRLRSRISALKKKLANSSSDSLASDCLFLKREAFDHEHEYRVVLSPKAESSHRSEIIAVPCDPHKFVDSILIDPRAPKELADAFIYYFKNKIGFKRRVQSSALYRVPTPVSSL